MSTLSVFESCLSVTTTLVPAGIPEGTLLGSKDHFPEKSGRACADSGEATTAQAIRTERNRRMSPISSFSLHFWRPWRLRPWPLLHWLSPPASHPGTLSYHLRKRTSRSRSSRPGGSPPDSNLTERRVMPGDPATEDPGP